VALDCETTGLNTRTDEIIAIGAVRIKGRRILTSQRLELLIRPEKAVSADSIRVHRLREQDVAGGLPAPEAVRRLLHFIGARPLVGYFLEFDVAMINRVARRCWAWACRSRRSRSRACTTTTSFASCRLPAARPGRHRPALCHHDGRPGPAHARRA
jgi:DNA polymerase III epsilon subunit-like protein